MNIDLLQKVKEQIIAEPAQFDMDNYFANASVLDREIPNCGMAACIGGLALAIWQKKTLKEAANDCKFLCSFRDALSLTLRQADHLFHLAYWPDRFARAYGSTSDLWERAHIAAARIEHFIATEGRE